MTQLAVFIMNWIIKGQTINEEKVEIVINNYNYSVYDISSSSSSHFKRRIRDIDINKRISNNYNATVYRIDSEHCNPGKVWQNLGSPTYPTVEQLAAINNASKVVPESIDINTNGKNSIDFQIDMPRYGLAVVVIDIYH